MKRIRVKHHAKRPFKHTAKKVRAWYTKGPLWTVIWILLFVVVVGGMSFGAYRYVANQTQESNSKSNQSGLDEIDGKDLRLSDSYESKDSDKKSDVKTKKKSGDGTATTSRNTNTENGSDNDGYEYDVFQDVKDKLVPEAYSVSLGGANGPSAASITMRSSKGNEIMWLSVSKAYDITTTTTSTFFNGVSVIEANLSRNSGGSFKPSRELYISQSDASSSGSGTVYVYAGYDIKPVAIKIKWSPRPTYSMEKTNQSVHVNGNVETYTLNFKITPNAYFGNPNLHFSISPSYATKCGAGSITTIDTTFNGTRNFSLKCIYAVPACNEPCPMRSGLTFKLNGHVKRASDNTFIYGSGWTNLSYIFNVP